MEAVLPSFGIYAELDEKPAEEELSEAISVLSNGRALDEDGIPAEIFKENKMLFSRGCMHCAAMQNTKQNAGRQNCYPVQN